MSSQFDDSSSFLFGLNHFASPQASGPGGPASASTPSNMNGNVNGGAPREREHMLEGLDAFGGQGNELLEGGSFADQLALWSSASFSFDGPVGHALLGDEDKEKDGKDDKEDDKDGEGNRRAGKRSRNNQGDDEANNAANGRDAAAGNRNGKNRLRDENTVAPEPTHQSHRDQAAQQQQQGYFAPPSSKADEARRPSAAQTPQQWNNPSRSNSQHDGKGTPGVPPNSFSAYNSPNAGQFHNSFAQNHSAPQTPAVFPSSVAAPSTPQGPLDLTSLLALQQLINHNPLALTSLGSFNNLNPQLGQLGGLGQLSNNANILQQLQQLQQQQQQQQARAGQGNGPPQGSQFSSPAFPQWGFQNGNGAFPNGIQPNGAPSNGAPALHGTSSSATSDRHEQASSDDGDSEEKSKMTAEERAELLAARAAERDNIPPLKLIDTGNPEADAEANRVAIEEDKRRRNTAASARFRMKKKQREAALEHHTKELEDTVSDLRAEIEKLRAENTWLKGLIQVRPNGGEADDKGDNIGAERVAAASSSRPNGANSSVEALQAAQQLQALQHAVSSQQAAQSQLQAHLQRTTAGNPDASSIRARDTGLRPRGVGTQTAEDDTPSTLGAQKRDREN